MGAVRGGCLFMVVVCGVFFVVAVCLWWLFVCGGCLFVVVVCRLVVCLWGLFVVVVCLWWLFVRGGCCGGCLWCFFLWCFFLWWLFVCGGCLFVVVVCLFVVVVCLFVVVCFFKVSNNFCYQFISILNPFLKIFDTSDLPPGVVNIISGPQDHLTRCLAEHRNVQGYSSSSTTSALYNYLASKLPA